MKYAASYTVHRDHKVFVRMLWVLAASRDEAIGKTTRIAGNAFPVSRGWSAPTVIVLDNERQPVEPEDAKRDPES